ncbi:hypothetical protein AAEO56_09390 [Flavobacterium sp. DGU11]|uniref:Uncharacterized protein n=1 Tax=Flavobacterium arundinis TaxID=3139143 RepID=A0ABU9HWC5_9FLAO
MKYIALLFLVILYSCKKEPHLKKETQNTIGIGLLHISIDKDVAFYIDENAKTPFDILSFSKTKTNASYHFKSDCLESHMKAYRQYNGDVDKSAESTGPSLIFKVLNTTAIGFTILLNEDTGETAYIKKEGRKYFNSFYGPGKAYPQKDGYKKMPPLLVFESWKDYLTRLDYIFVAEYLELYNAPNGSVVHREKLGRSHISFKITDVKGQWAKLGHIKGYSIARHPGVDYYQWIKWHDNNNLLIEIRDWSDPTQFSGHSQP